MHIEKQIREAAAEMIAGHLEDYADQIEEAYCKDDGPLKVNLSATFKETKKGLQVKTTIGFTTDKVKDSASRTIDVKQKELPIGDDKDAG